MLHPRTELDAYANSWPRDVDTRPGPLGDWPAPPTPPRTGQGRHRRRQRGRHRARADRATDVAAAVAAGAVTDMSSDRAATHTLGPFALPGVDVPPVDAWPGEAMPDEVMPGEAVAPRTPPETPLETSAEQTRPAGWWRVPGDAEPRHPRARPPAATPAAAEAAPVAERDRRPWLAGTALFVAVAIAGSWAVSSRQHPSDELPPPDTTAYGATGRLPDTHADSAAPNNNTAAPRTGGRLSRGGEATLAATSGAPGVAAVGDPRIPAPMARAYRSAEARLAATAPDCGLSWSLLAGIGKVESDHARGGNVDAAGTTLAPILGPALDGSGGNAAIPDTDRGALDGDTRWDRAVGPSQFIPTSWDIYGADGNDDGRADPNNAYDAATATGRYLCAGGLDLTDPADLNTAVFRYNHSQDYVDTVLGWARTYAGTPAAATAGPVPPVAAPNPATVIPVPPLASPPPRASGSTPTTSLPTAREPRRPAASSPAASRPASPRPAASSSAPTPRSRDSQRPASRPARPHSTPSRPTRPAQAPSARPAPTPTAAPDTSRPAPTDPTPASPRRPVPRTTPTPTTTPPATTTTTPSATSTPASRPGSPSTDPRALGCPPQLTTPTPTLASGLPDLPGSALLDDVAGSITLLGDCCNDW